MTRSYTPSQIADAILAGEITRDSAFIPLAEVERLRARVAALSDALNSVHDWLGVAIQCPAFQWDADEKHAAQLDYDAARAALEAKP